MSDPALRLNAALEGRCAIERELGWEHRVLLEPGGYQQRTFWAACLRRSPPAVLARGSLFSGVYKGPTWDLHPSGDRLVVAQDVESAVGDTQPERHIVVVNWFEELRARTGASRSATPPHACTQRSSTDE